jgi:hypothetical protein
MSTNGFGPGHLHAGSTPLDVALGELGVKEDPPGSNRGPRVDEYIRSGGGDPTKKLAWCVYFIRWCHRQCGIFLPKTASVKNLWTMAEDYRIDEPEQGCVFIHLNPDGTGHTGFVYEVLGDGSIRSVDGNSDANGSRTGGSVCWVTRPRIYFKGFLKFT